MTARYPMPLASEYVPVVVTAGTCQAPEMSAEQRGGDLETLIDDLVDRGLLEFAD